jgi:ABC-type multidrug transport system fused ATPase/permease subunit
MFSVQLTQKLAAYAAGRKLHLIILMGVLHAPMSFFDTTPIGRIINRFAKDIDSVDTALPNAFTQSFTALITVVTTLIILIYGSWFAIIEFIPLAILFAYIQVYDDNDRGKYLLINDVLFFFRSVFMFRLLVNFVVLIQ